MASIAAPRLERERRALGRADQVVVGDHAGVGVELAAGGQGDEVAPLLDVDEQHLLALGEELAHASSPRVPVAAPARRALRPLRRPPLRSSSTGTGSASATRSTSRQNAHTSPVVGAPHDRHGLQALLGLGRLGPEPVGRLVEEPEVEGVLGAGRPGLDGVERLLVAEVAVALGHRALLDDVVDAPQHAVGGRLPFAQPDQRLDLAGEPVPGRQHRRLPAEVLGLPVQHVAQQDGRLVVEVVAGGHDVEAAVERGLVDEVPLGHAARRARHPAGHRRRGGDVVAVVAAQVDAVQRRGPAPRRRRPRPRCWRRCSRRCPARSSCPRPRSRVPAAGPTAPGCPCRPTRPPAPARRGRASRAGRSPWPPGRGRTGGSGRRRSWRCGAGGR